MDKLKNNKVVIYARVSTDQQEGGLDTQINACNEYIFRNNLELVKVFADEAVSGTKHDRKAFNELKEFIKVNQVDIVVFQPDRIARDLNIWLDFVALCEEFNRTIHEVSVGEINTKTAVGQMTSKMRIVFAEFEKNLFMERSRAGAIRNLKEGRWIFRPPFGYLTKGNKKLSYLVPNSDIKPILQQVFLDYADNLINIPQAVEIMKKNNIKTSKTQMNIILNNIFYSGYYEYSKWDIGITKGIHEAIIPLSVVNKIKDRSKCKSRISRDEEFPLKTILKCIGCKRQLVTSKFKKAKFPYHYCKNVNCEMKQKYVSPKFIDQEIIKSLQTIKLDKKVKQAIIIIFNEREKINLIKVKQIQETLKKQIEMTKINISNAIARLDVVNEVELIEKYQKEYKRFKELLKGYEQELATTASVLVEPQRINLIKILEVLEKPDEMYSNGDMRMKLNIVKLAYNNNVIYSPIHKQLNLVFSDLVHTLADKKTLSGILEVGADQKLNLIELILASSFAF